MSGPYQVTGRHPKITIEDDNGKLDFAELFRSLSNPAFTPASIQVMTTAAASITATAAATPIAMGITFFPAKVIIIHNSLDNPVNVTINEVDAFRIAKGSEVIDLSAARLTIGPTARSGVYKTGSTPTAGELSITVMG